MSQSIMLELFHVARIQAQVLAKLQDKTNEICRDVYEVKNHLCQYAKWPIGQCVEKWRVLSDSTTY